MAQLSVTYDRDVLGDGYYLDVLVKPAPDTTAGDLETSIVVTTATEDIARFATLQDLVDLNVGGTLRWFEADTYGVGVPEAGDTLVLETIPDSWVKLGSAAPLSYTISYVIGTVAPFYIQVAPGTPFPSGFTGTLTYHILNGVGPTERMPSTTSRITIRRYYSTYPSAPTYVRVARATALYPSVEAAANKFEALTAQAQSLIDASNVEEESFDGPIDEVYT